MKFFLSILGAVLLVGTVGCAMCSSPFDYEYPAHGGTQQREDMLHGRVGSRFDPARSVEEAPPVPPEELPVADLPDAGMLEPLN